MGSDLYEVLAGDTVVAGRMSLEYALLLMRAMFQEFWNDDSLRITVRKETDPETELRNKWDGLEAALEKRIKEKKNNGE